MERQRRIDLVLFFLYCGFYAAFMVIAAFRQDWMAMRVVGGVNLAVAFGMGLILGAIGLALIATLVRRGEGESR